MAIEIPTRIPLSRESCELLKEIEDLFAEPQIWLEMRNIRLGGRRPIDVIGTADEEDVRDIIESMKHGFFT